MSTAAIVFWSLFAVLMVTDFVLLLKEGLHGTVTWMWWEINKTHPILTAFFGVFCGHLFPASSPLIPVAVGLALTATFLMEWKNHGFKGGIAAFNQNHAAVFLTGYLIGFGLWSETDYGK